MWRNGRRIHTERIQDAMRHLPGYEILFDRMTSGDDLLDRVQHGLLSWSEVEKRVGFKGTVDCRLRYDIYEKLTGTVDRSVLDAVVNVLVDTSGFDRACDESERDQYWPPHAQR